MSNIKKKQYSSIILGAMRSAVLSWRSLLALRGNVCAWWRAGKVFLRSYRAQGKNNNFKRSVKLWYPILHERAYYGDIDPVYLYQNAWCVGKVFSARPTKHLDVGSSLHLVSILGEFVPVIFVDLHNPELLFKGVSYQQGDICQLPFIDNSIQSISSLCVIEHIGLGRYGDVINAFGSEKAAQELSRVLAPSGRLYISVPVDAENRIYHNAHRAFTRKYVVEKLFGSCQLLSEGYIYGKAMSADYLPENGFGTGLFEFTKE